MKPLDALTGLGRLQNGVANFLKPVSFRVTHSVDEFTAASHLVYREYLKRGYVRSNAAQLKLSVYHALPATVTFVAVHAPSKVIGTLALIEDSPLGLPMDEVYKSEVDRLRLQGRRVAEVSMLALDTELFGHGVFTMFHAKKLLLTLRLFKTLFDYVRACTDVDEIVACFNPKHQILYDFLQLKPLGKLKRYHGANGNPAIARHLNIAETQERAKTHAAYQFFYGRLPAPSLYMKRLRFTAMELRQFFVIQTPIFASASPTELTCIKRCYPGYDFQAILQPAISTAR